MDDRWWRAGPDRRGREGAEGQQLAVGTGGGVEGWRGRAGGQLRKGGEEPGGKHGHGMDTPGHAQHQLENAQLHTNKTN